jgi:lambda family phage tail tape measure protein
MNAAGSLWIQMGMDLARLSSDMNKSKQIVSGAMGDMNRAIGVVKGALGALGLGFSALAFGRAITREALEAEQASNRLSAVLRATGSAAGFTKKQLDEMAESMALATQFDDESIRNAQTNLLKFGNIHEDVFTQALKLSADYAAFTGGDMVAATQAIGRALNDPITGMRALKQEVGDLTFREKELIAQLLAAGKVEEAQVVVLDKLTRSIGGTAEMMNTGLTQATKDFEKSWKEMLESLGKSDTWNVVVRGASAAMKIIKSDLDSMRNQVTREWSREAVGRISQGNILTPGGNSDEEDLARGAKNAALVARQAEALERIREAWVKAIPVLDQWKKKLDQLNGITQEQIALEELYGRTIRTPIGAIRVPGAQENLPQGAKDEILNRAREIDQRNQLIDRVTAQAQSIRLLTDATQEAGEVQRLYIVGITEANQDFEFQTSLIGKTVVEQERLAAARQIDLTTKEAIKRIDGELFPEQIHAILEQARLYKEQLIPMLQRRRDLERDFFVGSKRAFQAYAEEATNAGQNAANAITNSMRAMEDALTDFIMTGKFQFHEFANFVLREIARMTSRELLGGFSGWLAGMFSGGAGNPTTGGGTGATPTFAGATGGGRSIVINNEYHIDSRSDRAVIMQEIEAGSRRTEARIADKMERSDPRFRR